MSFEKIFLYAFAGSGLLTALAMLIWFFAGIVRNAGLKLRGGGGMSCILQAVFFAMGLLFIAIGVYLPPWMMKVSGGDQVQAFMDAVEAQDPDAAFGLLTEDLQTDLGGRYDFGIWFSRLRLERWSMRGSCSNPTDSRVDGRAFQVEDGERIAITFFVHKAYDEWKIQGINFRNLGDEYQVGQLNTIICSSD